MMPADYTRKRRANLRAAGICARCAHEPIATQRSTWYCETCLDRELEQRRAIKATGTCADCRKQPVAPRSKNRCAWCLERAALANFASREKLWPERQNAGICVQCAAEPVAPGSLYGLQCGAARAAAVRRYELRRCSRPADPGTQAAPKVVANFRLHTRRKDQAR